MFYKYAQQGQNIEAAQLQSLLNQEFLKGRPGDTFSLDECRSIVALMDLKVNGRLDQGEFSRLWTRLVHCQSVFQNIQKNSGVFLSSYLQEAVKNTDFLAGISVSNELRAHDPPVQRQQWQGQLPQPGLLPDAAGSHGKDFPEPFQGWKRTLPDKNGVDEPGHVQLKQGAEQTPASRTSSQ